MAVIVSDSRNAAYDGNLSTANAWYRAEYYQLHTSESGGFDTSTERFTGVTFANAGNNMGVAYCLQPVTNWRGYQYFKNAEAFLWEILGTATMTIASPCVVTKAGHGFSGGEEIRFTTTGALPGGLTANVHYFVKYIDANTFNLSATSGGANLNTSGTQSGTHTLYVVRRNLVKTPTDIVDTIDSIVGTFLTAFKWASGYAVDTTASKWQFSLRSVAGTGTGNWSALRATNAESNIALVAWCDNQVTASSGNDALVIVDKIIPDASFQTKAYAVPSGGSTLFGVCGWICSQNGQHGIDNCESFYMNTSPASPITLTIDGCFLVSSHATVRFGKSSSRITGLTIDLRRTPTVGSASYSGFFDARQGVNYYGNEAGQAYYGSIPTTVYGELASDCAVGSASVVLTDATGFAINDYVLIGKGEGATWLNGATGATTQVTNIVGNTLTISPANGGAKRLAGAKVYRLNAEFGITIKSDSTSAICEPRFQIPGHFVFSGVLIRNIRFGMYFGGGLHYPNSNYNSQWLIEDVLAYNYNRSAQAGFRYLMPSSYGLKVNRAYFLTTTGSPLEFSVSSAFQTIRTSDIAKIETGGTEITNCHFQSIASGTFDVPSILSYLVMKFNDNLVTNTNGMVVGGAKGSEFKRNTVFGCSNGYSLYSLNGVTGIEDNSVQSCGTALTVSTSAPTIIKSRDTGSAFGDVVANTEPIYVNPSAYIEMEFADFTGSLTPSSTQLGYATALTDGTVLAFTNTSTRDDKTIQKYGITQRCGTGLTDTTAYPGLFYSQRMCNTDGANQNRFEWQHTDRPIGNQQGDTLVITGWVRIKTEDYWGGTTYERPRLYVYFDDGFSSSAYAEATAIAADTVGVANDGWQLLIVTITPTTTFGYIRVICTTLSDAAVEADRCVYWGRFGVSDGAGNTVNTGDLNDWAVGVPATPIIATTITAADVWAADPSTFGAGTVGAWVNKLLSVGKFLGLK